MAGGGSITNGIAVAPTIIVFVVVVIVIVIVVVRIVRFGVCYNVLLRVGGSGCDSTGLSSFRALSNIRTNHNMKSKLYSHRLGLARTCDWSWS